MGQAQLRAQRNRAGQTRGVAIWLTLVDIAGCLSFMLLFAQTPFNSVSGKFRLPPGFVLDVYADEKLANDIYAMTLDEQGRVVVTSAGYIKRLEDTDGDGRADRAIVLATPRRGGMGLLYDGDYLYYCGDGWLARYRRTGPLGELAREPEKIIPLVFSEHGGHAVRKGPDGWWYVIAGNDAGVSAALVNDPRSPIQQPQAGCLVRFRPSKAAAPPWQVQVVACGFRNPYDFDFGPAGELFTYDSDVERTFLLPWYVPTRVYHIGWGGHHGWRLPGYLRSWARCDDYLDTVEILWPVGRGSPTGVVCYRHYQFPEHYRGGLFLADWTFGRVYYVPLALQGSTYTARLEVFLEPTGQEGFAPTDLAVGPNGELYVCIGGRRTRGAVYRIRYVGSAKRLPAGEKPLDQVLRAPQPLDAWSRAVWEPLARKLAKAAFLQAARDPTRTEAERVRAIEIVTELFGGLDREVAQRLVADASVQVRAATAWALGCIDPDNHPSPHQDGSPLLNDSLAPLKQLLRLATDQHPLVRRRALEALLMQRHRFSNQELMEVIRCNLGSGQKRVRQAAARIASLLPEMAWQQLWERRREFSQPGRLALCLAACWRHQARQPLVQVAEEAANVIASESASLESRFEALRLIMLACGDWELDNPPVEIFTGYTLRHQLPALLRQELVKAIHRHWPGQSPRWNQEAARLLAMLRDDSSALPQKLGSLWSPRSDPTWDVHYLIVLACSTANWPEDMASRVADILIHLHERLEGKQLRVKLTWGDRLTELVQELVKRQPKLASCLARHPKLVEPGHVVLALALPEAERAQAAQRFFQVATTDAEFVWTPALVELLGNVPGKTVLPAFRSRLSDPALRPTILKYLARHPSETDRQVFLEGLESAQPEVVRACLEALERLPVSHEPKHQAWLLRGLRSLVSEAHERELRQRIARLYCESAGIAAAPWETKKDSKSVSDVYRPLWDEFLRRHPECSAVVLADLGSPDSSWQERLARIDWSQGRAQRGEILFRKLGCLACHTGQSRIGPDLAGVTNRLSRQDLFEAIFYPSRDVAPAYRVELVETRDGQVHAGVVIFESADGLILQTDATTTIRLATEDIAQRVVSRRSLMPDGLLRDLSDADLADLDAFLQTLRADTPLVR